jgi:hypothetical protein
MHCIRKKGWPCAMLAAASIAVYARPASAIISGTSLNDAGLVTINTFLGATTFYNFGFFGRNAIVANIEGGAIWNGHETTLAVNTFIFDPSISPETDLHPTAVGMVIAGSRPAGQPLFFYQAGIAPFATLWSGAIATNINNDGSFDLTNESFIYPYKVAMETGINGKTADVINSSWGTDSEQDGNSYFSVSIDALTHDSGKTVVFSAGNSGPNGNTVNSPASGFNTIVAGALALGNPGNPYSTVADFSSRGPSDIFIPADPNGNTGTTIHNARARVDITAPGDSLIVAYYGGTTGENRGGTDVTNGDGGFYLFGAAGTSFSAPIISGAAALLADVGHSVFGGHSTDGRVIKAILLNSADKLAGWDNGQKMTIQGVIQTSQALDYGQGAGRVNMDTALFNYGFGVGDVPGLGGGSVPDVGWDYGSVSAQQINDYLMTTALSNGNIMNVTLDWFATDHFDDATLTPTYGSLENLELQVWTAAGGVAGTELADSNALYTTVQELHFALPGPGQYIIRVMWAGELYNLDGATPATDYAVAWNVIPEPSSAAVAMLGAALSVLRRRRPR